MWVRSDDAQIYYETAGSGPDVMLLHAFPAGHGVWLPVAERLAARYRCILPDLRGHGQSEPGNGPATMAKHAADILRVCADAGVQRAVIAGVSIGGYIAFELWRQARERFSALILCDTRAQADSEETRASRLQSIEKVRKEGPTGFLDAQLQRLIGQTTRRNRPDIASAAREMMGRISAQGIAAIQQGMAERPDSVATLATITVPTLVIVGDEDEVAPRADAELMQRAIPAARIAVIAAAGHYAPLEQPESVAREIRQFLDRQARG